VCYDPARVDILIDYRPALRQRTGVGEYVHGLAAALASTLHSDDTLTLFSSSWKDRLSPETVPGARQIDRRVPVRLLNFTWQRLEWPPIETFVRHADVVHSPHPLLIPSRSAAQIVTIHDLHFVERPDHTSAEIRRDYPVLARSHAKRADAVIVNSNYTAQQVIERFEISPDRITVCYPGKPAWKRREEPGARGPILFIGTAEPRKNLARLIEAYARLVSRAADTPDLVIAGRLGISQDELFALVRFSSDARARVQFTGYVSDMERQRLFAEASVLTLPSLEEGFGITALEAMTVGLPVVASNGGALPEVVADAGILVDPEDVQGLSAALERVLSDSELRRSMSDKGVARSERFSWASSAERLYDAYRGAHRRRRAR
jgi:glycosyltransferase involved in cell wall biosynthesis